MSDAVEFASTGCPGTAIPPEAFGCVPVLASTFICCELAASAICNLPHSQKSRLTRASTAFRNCVCATPAAPALTVPNVDLSTRLKLRTSPRGTHGDEGACRLKLTDGSNTVP